MVPQTHAAGTCAVCVIWQTANRGCLLLTSNSPVQQQLHWSHAHLQCGDVVQDLIVLLAHLVPPPGCLDAGGCLLLAQRACKLACQQAAGVGLRKSGAHHTYIGGLLIAV